MAPQEYLHNWRVGSPQSPHIVTNCSHNVGRIAYSTIATALKNSTNKAREAHKKCPKLAWMLRNIAQESDSMGSRTLII